jgi:hypothetical protein
LEIEYARDLFWCPERILVSCGTKVEPAGGILMFHNHRLQVERLRRFNIPQRSDASWK